MRRDVTTHGAGASDVTDGQGKVRPTVTSKVWRLVYDRGQRGSSVCDGVGRRLSGGEGVSSS